MMEQGDILNHIRLGEDGIIEFKQILFSGHRVTDPHRSEFAADLAAFANTRGGTLLLGVHDKTREILGIPYERLDDAEKWVREICNDSIRPPLNAFIRKIELPDSTGKLLPIIRIDIDRSLFVHESTDGYWWRIGASKRKIPPEVLARLFQERSQSRVIRFDESPVPNTTLEELDSELAARFLRDGAEQREDTLRKLCVITNDGDGVPRLSVAGVLLATRTPQRRLPYAEIQAVAYAGDRRDINYQIDARDIAGPLDTQVLETLSFLRRNVQIAAVKRLARIEYTPFSERAAFEALVNAVAHRDYSMAGARIRMHLFTDRLELYVPGALANTLTPDSLHLRQYSRNELVVSLLARCRTPEGQGIGRSYFMDRRGDGVPIIQEECYKFSGRPAEYSLIDEGELRLVMRFAPFPEI